MTLRSALLAAALCGLSASAFAQTPTATATPAPSLSLDAVTAKLQADGFKVSEIERYADAIEVKGRDKAGVCVELRLDPRSGAVLRRERDDDCDHSSDDRRSQDRR